MEDEISELQVQRAQEEALRKETIRTLNKCEADLKQAKENWIPHSIRSLNFAQIELEETKAYLKREIVVIQARIKGIDERIIQATQRVKEIERVLQAAAERVRVADEERLRAREAEIRRQREKEQEAERARAREEERIKAREAEIRRQKEKEREAEQEKARAREEERLKREAELSRQREKEQEAEQARARARAWEAYIRRQREEVMRMKEEKAKVGVKLVSFRCFIRSLLSQEAETKKGHLLRQRPSSTQSDMLILATGGNEKEGGEGETRTWGGIEDVS